MALSPWINPAHFSRCRGKRQFRFMVFAERKAEQASIRANELILAYECCDCGWFHIGHADLSQRLARIPHIDRPCLHCAGVIPDFKKQRAKNKNSIALYCSDACRKAAAKNRRKARKTGIEGHA